MSESSSIPISDPSFQDSTEAPVKRRRRRRASGRVAATRWRALPLLLGLLAAGYLAVVGLSWLQAELYGYQAKSFMERLDQRGFAEEGWLKADQGYAAALVRSPDDARWHEGIGWLEDRWIVSNRQADPQQVQIHFRRGLEHYRRSLELRPKHYSTWLNLALFKSREWQFDGEFFQAVRLGVEFGPSSPYVVRLSTALALAYWPQYAQADRQLMVDLWERSALQGALLQAIIRGAEGSAPVAELCALPEVAAKLAPRCSELP